MTRKLTAYAAGLMACSAFTSPVLAQDGEEALAAPANDDNVIIVTATRRASDVQDIPIAVTAVTPAQIQQQGIVNIQTLGSVAPSFNIQSSQTESQGTSIRIRGIGTTGNNIGLESAVGVFIDGVYQSRPGIALGELVDVAQVEVLRGPQGTLFGRNTTAGALVVRNKAPNLNGFEGFAQATYGNFNFINVQGAVNTPVSESLGFRFTGAYRERDGILSTNGDGNEANTRDRYMVRGQLLWEPSADISLRIIGDYQSSNEACCDSITLNAPSGYSAASVAAAFPNGVAAPFNPTTTGQVRLPSLTSDDLVANGQEIANDVEQWGVSAELVWDLGGVEFTGLIGYRDFVGDSIQDDFQAIQNYSVGGITEDNLGATFDEIQTLTFEARLQGTAFNDSLDWLVGVYYADEDIRELASLTLGPDFQAFTGEAAFGSVLGPLAPAFQGLIPQAGAYLQSVAAGAPDPTIFATPISSDNAFALNEYTQQGSSFSVFTHNIVSVTDTLSLTFGLRYVDDKKDGQYDQLDASNNACLAGLTLSGTPQADAFAALEPILGAAVAGALSTPALNGPGSFINCFPFAAPALGVAFLPAEFDLTFEDDEFIYTGQVGWEPNPDLLAYASFTHGYKAGGFNLDSTAAASGGDPRFRSEEIDAYELGIKATLLDGRARANFAFFYNELADFQVLEFTGTQFQTFNVDDVTAQGFEVELFSQWNDYVSNSLAVTYTDASYGDACDATFVAAGGPNPALGLCGTSLTNAPEITVVGGMTYDGPLFKDSDWSFLANVNVRYETERRTNTRGLNAALQPVAFDFQDSNAKVNARIGFTSPDEKIGIEIWGRNLTNEITRSITFNTPLAGDSRSAFIEDPRTYGVTVRSRF